MAIWFYHPLELRTITKKFMLRPIGVLQKTRLAKSFQETCTSEQVQQSRFFPPITIWRKIWMQHTFWRNFAWNSIGLSFSPKNLNHAACIAAPQCTKRRYLMQTNWIDRNSNVYNIRFCAIWSIFVNSKNSTLIANWHAFVSVSDKSFRQIARRYYSLVKIGLTVCQNDQYSFFKRVCRFT